MSDFLAGSLWEARESNQGLQTPGSISLQTLLHLAAARLREAVAVK